MSKMYHTGLSALSAAGDSSGSGSSAATEQQQREYWASFQFSAAVLTQFYKSAIDSLEVIHQQSEQRVNNAAAVAVAAAAAQPHPNHHPLRSHANSSPHPCASCQKPSWCQSCGVLSPARSATPGSTDNNGKKSPLASFVATATPPNAVPMSMGAVAEHQLQQHQHNRLKRAREPDLFPAELFLKRFRRNHNPDDHDVV